jgi:hypothetical protein
MALATGEVVVKYRADTAEYEAQVTALAGTEKKLLDTTAQGLAQQAAAYQALGTAVTNTNTAAAAGAKAQQEHITGLQSSIKGLSTALVSATDTVGKMTKSFGEGVGRFQQFIGLLGMVSDITTQIAMSLSGGNKNTDKEDREAYDRHFGKYWQNLAEHPEDYIAGYDRFDEYAQSNSVADLRDESLGGQDAVKLLLAAAQRSPRNRRERARLLARNAWIKAGRPDNRAEDAYTFGHAEAIDLNDLALQSTLGVDWDAGARRADADIASRGPEAARLKAITDSIRVAKEIDASRAQKNALRGGVLASVFGTPEEIKGVSDALSLATKSVDLFTGAMQAGMDAWITGSESFGKAFKGAIAEGLRALSSEFLGQSLRHGLFALGELAFGNIAGASAHGTAAAAFGAGTVAVGAIARELGAGGGGAAGGGGVSGVGLGAGVQAAPSAPAVTNIVIGSDNDYDTPRSRSARFNNARLAADRYRQTGSGVRYQ